MSKNKLQNQFPMIRSRQEIMAQINGNPYLNQEFSSWTAARQKEFLDFCTGERGVKIMYDSFFKEIFNPEYHPERLEEVISLVIQEKVKRIVQVLPNDSTRIADETSLLITDIVVELEDGSIVNVEVQKLGFNFPGQRSACYSADLLLRQYKRVKDEMAESPDSEGNKRKFSYRDIKNVYTIVFYENSTSEFKAYPNDLCHIFQQQSNTGIKLELLQKYFFLPLDICLKNLQTKPIDSKLRAWLFFLSTDRPEDILKLLKAYPEFNILYQEIYQMCRNIEGVMDMFSEELHQLDRNTVQYMIDQMQEEIEEKDKKILEMQEKKTKEMAELEEKKTKEMAALEEKMKKKIQDLERQLAARK